MAEGFLRRWSRLKTAEQGQAVMPGPVPGIHAETPPPAAEASHRPDGVDARDKPGHDEPLCEEPPLPPLDSLCADSDYTPFLRPGVPEVTKLLALRKAWSSDPVIADFRGFGEYDWDCNAPGYGQLLPTDDIGALCDRVFRPPPEEAGPTTPPERKLPTEEVQESEQANPICDANGPQKPAQAEAETHGGSRPPDGLA